MEKEVQSFEFGILRIVDVNYHVDEMANPSNENIQIGYGMDFFFEVQDNWIEFIIRVDFVDKKTGQSFLAGGTLTKFSVKNLAGFLNDKDVIVFPNNSVETLFGIAFNHMRAILSKNSAASKFNSIIVPIVDSKEMFSMLLKHNFDLSKKMNERQELQSN